MTPLLDPLPGARTRTVAAVLERVKSEWNVRPQNIVRALRARPREVQGPRRRRLRRREPQGRVRLLDPRLHGARSHRRS